MFTFLGKPVGVRPARTRARPGGGPSSPIRLLGLVVLVPVIEELFWRSFLMRWMIDNDFLKVPIGKVTPMAAAVTSALFALAHPGMAAGLA